jgi:hypothetical protein
MMYIELEIEYDGESTVTNSSTCSLYGPYNRACATEMVNPKIDFPYSYYSKEHQTDRLCCNLESDSFEFVFIPKELTEEERKRYISYCDL